MPVLKFKQERVIEALGLSLAKALEVLERLKAEVSVLPDGSVELEVEVDRPDLYSLEGIARAARGLLGKETGVPRYELVNTDILVKADDVPTRPYVVAAVVWNVNVDEAFLEELIQFQEKLHNSHGKNREWVAIGLHDYDKLPSREIYYRFDDIDYVRFRPLGHDKEMTLRRVLEETEQGIKYGKISLMGGKHPVLYSGSEVISVPPVINAELTRIEPGTRNIFIDVTGVHKQLVLNVLKVLVANLAERGKGRIGLVEIHHGDYIERQPNLESKQLNVEVERISEWLGLKLDVTTIVDALKRARFDAQVFDDNRIRVSVPAYRFDVLGWVDIAEEVAIILGVNSIRPKYPEKMMRGKLLEKRYWERYARLVLAGLGFQELYSYTLVNCEKQSLITGLDKASMIVIANPVSIELDCLRSTLLVGLLEAARINTHSTPLRVFEIGDVVTRDRMSDTQTTTRSRIGILYMAYKAGYEDIQAVVYTLLRSLGDEVIEVMPYQGRPFMKGRAARIKSIQGIEGVLGELDPAILEEIGIDYPVAAAELDYTDIRRQ